MISYAIVRDEYRAFVKKNKKKIGYAADEDDLLCNRGENKR